MAITRVTQNMLTQRSVGSLQNALARLAETQEHLSTGRILNRPSDSPTDTTIAMRLRSTLVDQQQFARSAQDGLGWVSHAESTLTAMGDQLRRARELVLQGANTGGMGPEAREALALEIEEIRESLLAASNVTYLDRPVFGGVTPGHTAYDATGAFVGVPGQVTRTIADGVRVTVNVMGPEAFGDDGDNVFDHLVTAAAALRAGDSGQIAVSIDTLKADLDRMSATVTRMGTAYGRLDQASATALDKEISVSSHLATIENVDLPRAMVDLQMQEVAYQASLAATARVLQPSLVSFLR